MKITILDPAMCCSTGVCGEEVDDTLVETAAHVKWLKSLGYQVDRYNISNDGDAFKQYPEAIERLKTAGVDSLPYILVNGSLAKTGAYPTKTEWMQLLADETSTGNTQLSTPQNVDKTAVLFLIGAAITASNGPALKKYVSAARTAGISIQEVSQALNIGNDLRGELSQNVIQEANTLMADMQPASNSCAPGSGCC